MEVGGRGWERKG